MNDEILDEPIREMGNESGFYFPWFQAVDALFYVLFVLVLDVLLIDSKGDANIFEYIWYSWMIFYLVKTGLEFKNKLITIWGVLMTLILGYAFLFVFPSLMLDRTDWEATKFQQLIVFMFVPIIMVLYPLLLKNVSRKIKLALLANFLLIFALSTGMLYLLRVKIFDNINLLPIIFSFLSPLIFVYIYTQPMSQKENYHVNWMAFITLFYLYCFYINIS